MTIYRIFIQGIVQGVGFRPYIYRKAIECGLSGTVKNTGNGVEIIVNDEDFINKLHDLPPLAKITGFSIERHELQKQFPDFSILKSTFSDGETELPGDFFMCDECRLELGDNDNRRHNYYFITCTNCGPRFSMIEDYPYDRHLTSMQEFDMCPACSREYNEPLDRRYHAQTIACKECGPKLRLLHDKEDMGSSSDIETIKIATDLIKAGEMLSIKGVGGFHLCSLTKDDVVDKVRKLLRPHKPFALMVRDMEMLEKIAHVSEREKELLCSPQRPIVVLQKKRDILAGISELDTFGVMLPYTALHYLLFKFIDEPLLMTSCNVPGEPVAITETNATYVLTHERKIVNRCDDSVLKVINGIPFFLRRSRGYTPMSVQLPGDCKDTIAVGAELNNTMCATRNDRCFLSQHIGDCSKLETVDFLKSATKQFVKLARLKPEVIACDLHEGYTSTFFAQELAREYGAQLVPIQHHKAHIAGVAAEHGLDDCVGIAMDGMGLGDDGNIWGGEVFDVNDMRFRRIGHLEEQPQLGGDSSVMNPKKMLFGILSNLLDENELTGLDLFHEKESRLYLNQLKTQFNVPYTSSAGRILDAVSALLGVCEDRTYEGRPAMLLESTATKSLEFDPVFSKKDGNEILMTTPLFEFLLDNMDKDKGELAATAQMYLAGGLFGIARRRAGMDNKPVVFSGGVAYNRMISGFMIDNGVLVNREIPCGDGGLCYGQVVLANLD
ncbi:MAG: carbamoyltransferase HypF [Methanosarcinales archaeon]|nr:carbamoyltransferase HypF [Methanosarcinales archaeon]